MNELNNNIVGNNIVGNQNPVNNAGGFNLLNMIDQVGEKARSQLDKIHSSKVWDFGGKVKGGAFTIATAAVSVPLSLLIGIPNSIFRGACGLINSVTKGESFQQILQEGNKGLALGLVVPALLTIAECAESFYLETGLLKNFSESTMKLSTKLNLNLRTTLTEIEDKVSLQFKKTVDYIMIKSGLSRLIEKTQPFWDISQKVIGGIASILYAAVSIPMFLLIGIPTPFVTAAYALFKTISAENFKQASTREKFETVLLTGGKGFLLGLTLTFEIAILQNLQLFSSSTGLLQNFHAKLDDFVFKLHISLE